MVEWTDKHYNFTYKLTQQDIEAGEIKVDPYFVGMVWKTGSRDDSGALAHCLKTIARFGDKNSIEREIKALYAQVKGLARVNGIYLEGPPTKPKISGSPWYPDDSGKWLEYDGSGQPVGDDVIVEVLLQSERDECYAKEGLRESCYWNWDIDAGEDKIVAYKIIE